MGNVCLGVTTRLLAIMGLLFVSQAGCAADEAGMAEASDAGGKSDGGGTDAGRDGGPPMCVSDQDCGPGLVCVSGICRTPAVDGGTETDIGPPEDEHLVFQQPVSSENFVFVVNTTQGAVAKIAPGRLSAISVNTIEVGVQPTELRVVPGSDNVVVLNVSSRSLSFIQSSEAVDEVQEVDIGQPYTSMEISPDGRFVVVFFDQSEVWTDPSNSASKIAIVDVEATLAGDPRVYEFAVGYRVTGIFFDRDSTRLLVVSKSEIAVAELGLLNTTWILPRVWIDNPEAETVELREVLVTPDARLALIRNFHSHEITVVDIDENRSSRFLLHGVPTDLDLSPDGRVALVVERGAGIIARVDLEDDLRKLVEVDGVNYFDPDEDGEPTADEITHVVAVVPSGEPLEIGQAEIFTTATNRLKALLYTNVARREEISIIDLPSMEITYLDRLVNKLVDYVVISPTAQTALVVHRAENNSPETDPVELEIDQLNGYTLVDLGSLATFQQVAEAPVGPMAFSSNGRYALLTIFQRQSGINELHVIDLRRLTLQMDSVPLEAVPQFAGVLPGREIGYVAQEHAYGKITFIDLMTMDKRAVTGYELNAD